MAVIGSGQSALECAALLHEADADVEVLSRAGSIFMGAPAAHSFGPIMRFVVGT